MQSGSIAGELGFEPRLTESESAAHKFDKSGPLLLIMFMLYAEESTPYIQFEAVHLLTNDNFLSSSHFPAVVTLAEPRLAASGLRCYNSS
jgi:hypothetical protein